MSNVNGYILNKIKNKNTYKNFCFFMIGLFINTLSINLFYIPNNVVSTGSTGLAILINNCICYFFNSFVNWIYGFWNGIWC